MRGGHRIRSRVSRDRGAWASGRLVLGGRGGGTWFSGVLRRGPGEIVGRSRPGVNPTPAKLCGSVWRPSAGDASFPLVSAPGGSGGSPDGERGRPELRWPAAAGG